jgi:hypothetical protein
LGVANPRKNSLCGVFLRRSRKKTPHKGAWGCAPMGNTRELHAHGDWLTNSPSPPWTLMVNLYDPGSAGGSPALGRGAARCPPTQNPTHNTFPNRILEDSVGKPLLLFGPLRSLRLCGETCPDFPSRVPQSHLTTLLLFRYHALI